MSEKIENRPRTEERLMYALCLLPKSKHQQLLLFLRIMPLWLFFF